MARGCGSQDNEVGSTCIQTDGVQLEEFLDALEKAVSRQLAERKELSKMSV